MRTLFALLILAPGLRGQDADEFIKDKEGFKIRRPDATWLAVEVPPGENGRFGFKIQLKGADPEVSVMVVTADPTGVMTAEGAADYAEKSLKNNPMVAGLERAEARLGGVKAAGVKYRYGSGEKRFQVALVYAIQDDTLFSVMTYATDADLKKHAETLRGIVDSFAFVEADPKVRAKAKKLRQMVGYCGSEVAWTSTWAEASRKARREKKPVIVAIEKHAYMTKRHAATTPFMDRDFVALVNERFVPLWWQDDTTAPFQNAETYGLGPHAVGRAILFLSPDGAVIGEAASFNPMYLDVRARELLAAHPEYTGAAIPDSKRGLDRVELHLRRGELDEAAALLKEPDSARAWHLKAKLHARRREGTDALDAFAKAREAGDESIEADLDVDEAVLRFRRGDYANAADRLKRVTKGPRLAEAMYWSACVKVMREGIVAARPAIEEIVERFDLSPWGWAAAAMLNGQGFMSGIDRGIWPQAPQLEAAAQPAFTPVKASDAAAAEAGAVTFLIQSQARDGSWQIGMIDSPESAHVAVTSLCGASLLPHRADGRAGQAAKRALAWVVDAVDRNLIVEGQANQADFSVWARVYALRFLARCEQENVGEKAVIRRVMKRLAGDLVEAAREGGGWSYLKTGTDSDRQSISFLTAAVLGALREAGADAKDATKRAIAALTAMTRKDGSFAYSQGPEGLPPTAEEASRRGPICAVVLKRAGKGDEASVGAALDIFLKHRARTRRERGKALYHTGEEGTASYYLLFGVMHAAEAVAEAPADRREEFRAALLNEVLQFRAKDGSFYDSPVSGRAVGTAMALEALRLLTPP